MPLQPRTTNILSSGPDPGDKVATAMMIQADKGSDRLLRALALLINLLTIIAFCCAPAVVAIVCKIGYRW